MRENDDKVNRWPTDIKIRWNYKIFTIQMNINYSSAW